MAAALPAVAGGAGEKALSLSASEIALVLLVDYDGCLGHFECSADTLDAETTLAQAKIIDENPLFIKFVKDLKSGVFADASLDLASISLRAAAKNLDEENAKRNHNGRAETPLQRLAKQIDATYDEDKFYEVVTKPDALKDAYDETKTDLLLWHVYKYAAQYKEKEVRIMMFDDREDILKKLSDFLLACPALVPWNVTIDFCIYNGKKLELHSTVVGSGMTIPTIVTWQKNLYRGLKTRLPEEEKGKDKKKASCGRLTSIAMEEQDSQALFFSMGTVEPGEKGISLEGRVGKSAKLYFRLLDRLREQIRYADSKEQGLLFAELASLDKKLRESHSRAVYDRAVSALFSIIRNKPSVLKLDDSLNKYVESCWQYTALFTNGLIEIFDELLQKEFPSPELRKLTGLDEEVKSTASATSTTYAAAAGGAGASAGAAISVLTRDNAVTLGSPRVVAPFAATAAVVSAGGAGANAVAPAPATA